jgi:hypothetical protein
MHKLLVGLPLLVALPLLVVAGCGTVAPPPSVPPTLTPTGTAPSIGAAPTSSASAALVPCESSQVRLTPGAEGAAAGTDYLTVFVELDQGPACTLPWGPMIAVRDAAGAEIATATETDTKPVALTYISRYYIAWSGDCGPIPSGDLTAHIAFSSTVSLEMSIGTFRPSCVDGTGQTISMFADEPAS